MQSALLVGPRVNSALSGLLHVPQKIVFWIDLGVSSAMNAHTIVRRTPQLWRASRQWRTAFCLRWRERIEDRAFQETTKYIKETRHADHHAQDATAFHRK